MSNEIWVVLEHRDGKVKKASLEAVAVAKKTAASCGGTVSALLLGSGVEGLASQAAPWGADKVLHVDDENLETYNAHPYADVIAGLAKEREPLAIIATASPTGRDFAPRVAAKLGTGLLADVIELEADDKGLLTAKRPKYAGKIHATYSFREPRNQVVTLRPKVFEVEQNAGAATVEPCPLKPTPESVKTVVKEFIKRASTRPELTEADVIVSGGRGVKSLEGFKVIEELADVLGAAVGASRSAVDAGFRDHAAQVGQTGKVVNPKLYIACGISGAIQHLVGMGNSKFIVAVNKDPDAPIFKRADYGIVGDLFQVVPLLTEEFKKALA